MKQPHAQVVGANRFVQIMPFDSVDFICSYIPRNVQTVITVSPAVEGQAIYRRRCLLWRMSFSPSQEKGHHFETPWDGIPLVPRLTRWVVRSNPRL